MSEKDPIQNISQTEELTGAGRKKLRRWWDAGKFPKPTLINSRNYWRKSVIDAWLQDNFGGTE